MKMADLPCMEEETDSDLHLASTHPAILKAHACLAPPTGGCACPSLNATEIWAPAYGHSTSQRMPHKADKRQEPSRAGKGEPCRILCWPHCCFYTEMVERELSLLSQCFYFTPCSQVKLKNSCIAL